MLVNEYSLPVPVQKAAMHVANPQQYCHINADMSNCAKQALTASEVPARKIRVLRMARSPGLGLGVLGPLGDRGQVRPRGRATPRDHPVAHHIV